MPYYVLERGEGELYAMNMTLSEDEARRYGHEGSTVPVTAAFVWTKAEGLETFRRLLSVVQHEANSPFGGLVEDMRAGKVGVLELSADQLRGRLLRHRRPGFVAVDPGPEQRVRKIAEFLEDLNA